MRNSETGIYDELSSNEYSVVTAHIAVHLNLRLGENGLLVPRDVPDETQFPWNVSLTLDRIIRAGVEIPPKRQRLQPLSTFPRYALISVYRPRLDVVEEYVIKVSNTETYKVRQVDGLKRPVDGVEMTALNYFLAEVCGQINDFLRLYYQADFFMGGTLCASTINETSDCPMERPKCLFPMNASPTVTNDNPMRRITTFRLNRWVVPLNQFPTTVQFEVSPIHNQRAMSQLPHKLITPNSYPMHMKFSQPIARIKQIRVSPRHY